MCFLFRSISLMLYECSELHFLTICNGMQRKLPFGMVFGYGMVFLVMVWQRNLWLWYDIPILAVMELPLPSANFINHCDTRGCETQIYTRMHG